MGMKCNNCGKGVMYGHNVSHSKRRTPRTFKPNLHVARLRVNGNAVRVRLCTKCLRMVKKSLAFDAKVSEVAQVATA